MITKDNIAEESLKLLPGFKMALLREQEQILNRWLKFGMDKEQGGFYEIIDTDDKPDPTIPKTALTVSGVLYNFSKAYINSKNAAHLAMAERAALYLKNFRDHTHGGVFNALKGNTEPEDSGKNTRTHARVLSALCAYYHCVPSQVVKDISVALYQRIIQKAKDEQHGGFYENFSREWEILPMENGVEKNGYTQVVMLEAFCSLYAIWPDKNLELELFQLVELIMTKIIRENYFYLQVECKRDWTALSSHIIFGCDVETINSLQIASRLLPASDLADKINYTCIKIGHTASMGLDDDGGIWKKYFFERHTVVKEKEGWAQAEAMLAFFNTWMLSEEEKFLQQSLHVYHFIHNRIIDAQTGNWAVALNALYQPIEDLTAEQRSNYPMHNYRAMYETVNLINALTGT